jgi:TRAP-type C4-dicarboxylate transport system permease small subunit
MSEPVAHANPAHVVPKRGIAQALDVAAKIMAMSGGAIFCALIAMSIVSIVGRKLFSMPVPGDVELMQMGAAVGAAAFMPLCELHDYNIKVDALTGWMGDRARATFDALAHFLLTVAAALITWRTAVAAIDASSSGEVSTLLTIPVWQPVALLVPSFALLTLCGLYRVGRSALEAAGRSA